MRAGENLTAAVASRWLLIAGMLGLFTGSASAHLNSPDVFLDQNVGPYPAIIIVHMPPAIPGEAEVQVRLLDLGPGEEVEVLEREVPPEGESYAAGWKIARASSVDPDFHTVPAPFPFFGLWQVEVKVKGPRGEGVVTIPVRARVAPPMAMPPGLAVILIGMLVIFLGALLQILIALGRDTHLLPEAIPAKSDVRRGRWLATGGTIIAVAWITFLGYFWIVENIKQKRKGVSPVTSALVIQNPPAASGRELSVSLTLKTRRGVAVEGHVTSHGKPMDMVVVKLPDLSYFLHTYPQVTGSGEYSFSFNPPETGTYKLFGTIQTAEGLSETVTNVIEVGPGDDKRTEALDVPDASHSFPATLNSGRTGNLVYDVGDGLEVRWKLSEAGSIRVGEFMKLAFELVYESGESVEGIEPHVGSAGHLLIVRADGEVFAHVLPMGTLDRRAGQPTRGSEIGDETMQNTARVSFPYGFPEIGVYRLFVQMKHDGRVYTGVFDAEVS